MTLTNEQVYQVLGRVMDPEPKKNLVELGMVREVKVEDGRVGITLALTTLACPLKDQIMADAKKAAFMLDGVRQVEVELVEMDAEERQRSGLRQAEPGQAAHLNDVHRVIAVMSGKGGVGKSLVSRHLRSPCVAAGSGWRPRRRHYRAEHSQDVLPGWRLTGQ